jgi:hypothetical protein
VVTFWCVGCGAEVELLLGELGNSGHEAVGVMSERTVGSQYQKGGLPYRGRVVSWTVVGCRWCRWAGWFVQDADGRVELVELPGS